MLHPASINYMVYKHLLIELVTCYLLLGHLTQTYLVINCTDGRCAKVIHICKNKNVLLFVYRRLH